MALEVGQSVSGAADDATDAIMYRSPIYVGSRRNRVNHLGGLSI